MPFAVDPDTKSKWEQIRMACIAGTPDDTICQKYGVSPTALRARRSRERWPTQRRLSIERDQARRSLKNQGKTSVQSSRRAENVALPATEVPKAAEVALESLNEQVDSFVGAVVPLLLKQGKDSVTQSPLDFRPSNNKELGQLIGNVWKMTGRDKPETQVNLSLWSSQSVQPERDVTPQTAGEVDDELLK